MLLVNVEKSTILCSFYFKLLSSVGVILRQLWLEISSNEFNFNIFIPLCRIIGLDSHEEQRERTEFNHLVQIYLPWFLLFGFAIYHYDAVTNAKQAGLDMYQKMVFQEMATMKGYQDFENPQKTDTASQSRITEVHSPQTGSDLRPEITLENYQNECSVNRHVVFLKTHKTGR